VAVGLQSSRWSLFAHDDDDPATFRPVAETPDHEGWRVIAFHAFDEPVGAATLVVGRETRYPRLEEPVYNYKLHVW
jgi:hypothetical protein